MKWKVHALVPKVAGCSYRRFRSEVDAYVEREYPDLEDRYHQLLKVDLSFMWTHPEIDVEVYEGYRETRECSTPGGFGHLEEVMFGCLVVSQSDESGLDESSEEDESSEKISELSEQEDEEVDLWCFLSPHLLDERDKKTKDKEEKEQGWQGDVRPTKRPRHW